MLFTILVNSLPTLAAKNQQNIPRFCQAAARRFSWRDKVSKFSDKGCCKMSENSAKTLFLSGM
jgi:hypothetical protein